MRIMNYDQPKSIGQIKKDMGKKCKICQKPVTTFKGPGSDCLCREHQLAQVEYGGVGKIDRPHTFHRNADFTCSECGWSLLDDPRLSSIENEMTKRRVARVLLHGDHHFTRKADGGDDSAENVKSLCVVCHAKKTILNQDYKS